mgnify:CR=1 FL=1
MCRMGRLATDSRRFSNCRTCKIDAGVDVWTGVVQKGILHSEIGECIKLFFFSRKSICVLQASVVLLCIMRKDTKEMSNMKRVASLLVLPVLLALLAMPASYASAESRDLIPANASCSSHGHNLNATAFFYKKGGYHIWIRATWSINGKNTGNKNNVNIRVTADGVQKWAWDSPDSLSAGPGHVGMNNISTSAKAKEQVFFTGIFDTKGPDSRCTAVTESI